MKKLSILLIAGVLVISCASLPTGGFVQVPSPLVPSADCNAALDELTAGKTGASLIRAKIPNPCDAYKVAATAAKAGVVWDAYSMEALLSWTENLKEVVNAGLTYDDLKAMVALKIKAFNKKMGGTFLLLSDLVLVMESPALITETDKAILNKGFDLLLDEARKLALFTSHRPPFASPQEEAR